MLQRVSRLILPEPPLTLRRQKFVSKYVETGNVTQTARLAGYFSSINTFL